MASWYSKILTTTTSQISNLQSRLLQSENDGDTEDDTHVCRVLRAYYTEEGKPFPGWLPPDPKAPPPVAPTYSQPQVGSRYGRLSPQQTGASTGSAATGLSSLWDSSGRTAGAGAGQQQPQGRPGQYSRGGGFNDRGRDDSQSRLPSQRGGYQQNNPFSRDSNSSTPPGSGGSGGVSAQDKLKKRLWGGGGARTTSPSSGTGGPFQPPPGRGGGYSSGNRGGDSGDYESRFAPGGMYDASSSRGSGGDNKPFLAANSPWASNEDEFMGSGRSNRAGGGGLPSGPRRGAGGLPSGPRMR